jgi:hypothetical protein
MASRRVQEPSLVVLSALLLTMMAAAEAVDAARTNVIGVSNKEQSRSALSVKQARRRMVFSRRIMTTDHNFDSSGNARTKSTYIPFPNAIEMSSNASSKEIRGAAKPPRVSLGAPRR